MADNGKEINHSDGHNRTAKRTQDGRKAHSEKNLSYLFKTKYKCRLWRRFKMEKTELVLNQPDGAENRHFDHDPDSGKTLDEIYHDRVSDEAYERFLKMEEEQSWS
jgi:hypothetical protein